MSYSDKTSRLKQTITSRAQENVALADKLYKKAKKLGMRNPHTFSANLADIYFNFVDYSEQISSFLASDIEAKESIGGILVDIKITLEDARWQWGQARRSVERVIDRCYRNSDKKNS
jgi:hypothetical protein